MSTRALIQTDVLIIGGGPAGLSSALALSRIKVPHVLFDSGRYRNDPAHAMHTVIGFDGQPPSEFRRRARIDIEKYGITRFEQYEIKNIQKTDKGFVADDRWEGKRVILATGVKDLAPEIPGYEAIWGKSIVHCAFCHGHEFSGKRGGALGAASIPRVVTFTNIAADLIILLNGETVPTTLVPAHKAFTEAGFKTVSAKISKFESVPDNKNVVVHFVDDTPPITLDFIMHAPPTSQAALSIVEQLGVELKPDGDVVTSGMFGQTSVPGIYAAGDLAVMAKGVTTAMSMGSMAAAGAAHSILFERYGIQMPGF